jgi:hypothetical protein
LSLLNALTTKDTKVHKGWHFWLQKVNRTVCGAHLNDERKLLF